MGEPTRVQMKKTGRNLCPFRSDRVLVSRERRPGSSGGVRQRKTASWNATETENAERETSSEHSSGRGKEFCKLPVLLTKLCWKRNYFGFDFSKRPNYISKYINLPAKK